MFGMPGKMVCLIPDIDLNSLDPILALFEDFVGDLLRFFAIFYVYSCRYVERW